MRVMRVRAYVPEWWMFGLQMIYNNREAILNYQYGDILSESVHSYTMQLFNDFFSDFKCRVEARFTLILTPVIVRSVPLPAFPWSYVSEPVFNDTDEGRVVKPQRKRCPPLNGIDEVLSHSLPYSLPVLLVEMRVFPLESADDAEEAGMEDWRLWQIEDETCFWNSLHDKLESLSFGA